MVQLICRSIFSYNDGSTFTARSWKGRDKREVRQLVTWLPYTNEDKHIFEKYEKTEKYYNSGKRQAQASFIYDARWTFALGQSDIKVKDDVVYYPRNTH